MGYQTTSTDEPHVLDAPNAGVGGESTPVEEDVEPVGFANPDYTFNPVADPVDHEMPTDDLHRLEVPRHDRYAEENSGVTAERVVPYTPTGANPSYPQDVEAGFEEAPAEVPEAEPVVAEPEPVPGPADIPPPPKKPVAPEPTEPEPDPVEE